MRALFLLLVGANLALYAWSQYWAAPESASDREPLRRQVSPEKIRVLAGKDLAGLPAATKPRAILDSAAPKACLEWGGFAVAEAPRAEQALAPLALGERLTQSRREETAGWWVFFPPQGSRAGAQKKVAELKGLGIDEYFVVQEEGKMQWAVSLGVFTTEEAARARLEALRARGVRTALTGERETRVTKVSFQVRNPDAVLQAKLRDLAQAFPGTELRDCP
jgi:hypothetical protein